MGRHNNKTEWPEPYTRSKVTGGYRSRLGADGKYHSDGPQSDALWSQGIGRTMAIPAPPAAKGIGAMKVGSTFIIAGATSEGIGNLIIEQTFVIA